MVNFFDWLAFRGNVYQKHTAPLTRKFKILNPQGITLTVRGNHSRQGLYSTWDGDSYELAEVLTSGEWGQIPRPFMFLAKQKLKNDKSARKRCAEFLKMSISRKLKFSKSVAAEMASTGGVWIDWDEYGKWVCALIHSWIMDNTLNLPPLKADSQGEKSSAGFGSAPLYATGQLAQCISYDIR